MTTKSGMNDQEQTPTDRELNEALLAVFLDSFPASLRGWANQLLKENERLKTCGVCELAAVNPSVMDYVKHWEGRAEKAEAALREAASPKRVRVKPLDWVNHDPRVWVAATPFGDYRIVRKSKFWLSFDDVARGPYYDSLEIAQQYAQSDHEGRIRSQIGE